MTDYLDPSLAFGLAVALWFVYAGQCARVRRRSHDTTNEGNKK